jgi:hypothetical protein
MAAPAVWLRPQRSQVDIPSNFKKGVVCQFKNGKVCPPATFEAGARISYSNFLTALTRHHNLRIYYMSLQYRNKSKA